MEMSDSGILLICNLQNAPTLPYSHTMIAPNPTGTTQRYLAKPLEKTYRRRPIVKRTQALPM